GVLDAAELAGFLRRDADVELTVRLGVENRGGDLRFPQPVPPAPAKPGQAQVAPPVQVWDTQVGGPGGMSVTLATSRELPPGVKVTENPQGGLTVELGRTRIELGGQAQGQPGRNTRPVALPGVVADRASPRSLVNQYLAAFKAADADGNGYLDEKEAMQSPFFRNTFKLMDRDGDGKLYEKEVREYLATMETLESAVAGTGLTLNVADRGRGLFDVLDTNRDGRLSVREMRQIGPKFLALGRGGDALSRTEVPRDLRGSFTL